MFSVITMQRFDLKNSTIKLFLVVILNMYLYSEELSQSKSDSVVAMLQRGHLMPTFRKLVWFRVFLKWSRWSCKTTSFLPCQKQLCSQRLVSLHNLFTWYIQMMKIMKFYCLYIMAVCHNNIYIYIIYQLHYVNKVIEKLHYLLHFK